MFRNYWREIKAGLSHARRKHPDMLPPWNKTNLAGMLFVLGVECGEAMKVVEKLQYGNLTITKQEIGRVREKLLDTVTVAIRIIKIIDSGRFEK